MYADVDGGNLFTVRRIKAMCRLEDAVLRRHQSFRDACVQTTVTRQCCRSWSLGNYVSRLTNKSSCYDIRRRDVAYVEDLLTTCVPYYRALALLADCYDAETRGDRYRQCADVPAPCKRYNAVYDILHFLADVDFMADGGDGVNHKLSYSMSFLPVAAGTGAVPLYESFEAATTSTPAAHVKVVAVDFGVKQELFDRYLHDDVLWFGVALLAIVLAMWVYTTSLFLTLMAVVSLFLSLEISYFVYTHVFSVRFFPFMNLLVLVILIGVGADNVFIYVKTWTLAKQEKNVGTLEKIVSDTLRHATLSILVTSLTTAAAFYASYVSHITALACFAVFAGTAVVVNFVVVVTWLPASLVVYEKWLSDCCLCYGAEFYDGKRGTAYYARQLPHTAYERACELWRAAFEKLLPCAVLRLRVAWLLSLSGLALGAVVVVFYAPRLRLPTSDDFQLFSDDHLFEVFDLRMKRHFESGVGTGLGTMPITIVWGVKAVDAGDKLDPFSKGGVVYDDSFNPATPRAQRWLLRFCRAVRATDFYQREPGLQLTNCFIEHFKLFMESGCDATASAAQRACCGFDEFPYSEDVFNRCLRVYVPILAHSRRLYRANPNAGPRYAKDTGRLVALVVEFNSKEPYSLSYEKIAAFYRYMDDWVSERMLTAPDEMRHGWFVSLLDFYALQASIAEGTPLAIGIAIAVATVVAFLTTLNLLITFYAMLSIAAAIFVTIAALVLLGWQLNVLESVTISAAVGLSIDFTLHYGMAYRLSPDLDRQMRVACATARMGSPVAVAALTTFLAGALVMPSTVLAYRQLGTFLMVVMAVSWTYATFFFQSLLRCFGPEGGFGQFHWPTCGACDGGGGARWRRHVDKTVYTMSESTVSSSSVTHANNSSETHELEHLTDDARDPWRQQQQQHRLACRAAHHRRQSAESLEAATPPPTGARPPEPHTTLAERESCMRLIENNASCEQTDSLANHPNVWIPRHEHM